jgi:hypothetical protein
MKKIFEYRNIIILFLLIIVILEYCNPKGIMPNRVEYTTVVDSIPYPVHDTVEMEVEIPVEVQVPVEVRVPVEVQVVQQVDTANILKIYYTKNETSETLVLPNDVGNITLSETVSENKIIDRKIVNSKLKKQILVDTLRIPEDPKNKFYYGFNFSANREDFVNSLGVGMMMKTKSDKIYRIDLGLNNRVLDGTIGRFSPYIGGGVYWKIKSKENRF